MPDRFGLHGRYLHAASPRCVASAASNVTWTVRAGSYVEGECDDSAVVINSILSERVTVAKAAVVCHSTLDSAWKIGEGAFVSGIGSVDGDLLPNSACRCLKAGMALSEHHVGMPGKLLFSITFCFCCACHTPFDRALNHHHRTHARACAH